MNDKVGDNWSILFAKFGRGMIKFILEEYTYITRRVLMKKYNVIIDTDPGVDDTTAIVLSLDDEDMDIKLITTVAGNRSVSVCTRNMLHILDKFGADIPVAKGASHALCRKSKDAMDVHKLMGMGGYKPKRPKRKVIEKDAVEAMYEVIMESKTPVHILSFGPHTNSASLIIKHPEVKNKIAGIIGEGCCPYGVDGRTHISFNVSTDPEAFKVILDSGVPLTMVPSHMGREWVHLTEEEVNHIRQMNDTGAFLYEMFSGYWERGFPDKRIAINDSCICLYLLHPEDFTVVNTNITVDLDEMPGKTIMDFDPNGKHKYISGCNREKIHERFMIAIDKMGKYKFS